MLIMGLVTILLAGTAAAMIGLFTLDRLGMDVSRRLWLAKLAVFGPEPIGIWQLSDRFGWTHIPSATGRERIVPDYDVRYRIDPLGHRLVPGAPPAGAPVALFLGGSFTFGLGVEDSETYTANLQRAWPGLRVVNAAVHAWGTTQALLMLEDKLSGNDQIALVVYGFISQHPQRNYLRRSWLDTLSQWETRRNPYFEIDRDRIVFQGLAGPVRDGVPDSPELDRRELLMTRLLLRRMALLCADRNVPFVVIYLPDGTPIPGPAFPVLVRAVGAEAVFDLRPLLNFSQLHFKHDYHLSPLGHSEVASKLLPFLEARLPGDLTPSSLLSE